MNKYFLTIDLGTTNIKVGLFNNELKEVSITSLKVDYLDSNKFAEFSAEYYWNLCKDGIKNVLSNSKINPGYIISISLTSQAESLVLLGNDNYPLRNAISWMDNRSVSECEFLKKHFDNRKTYEITGLPELITTWPITKILWIKNNEKDIFKRVKKYLLIKDYIAFKFTGKFLSEFSVSSFTYYFDIRKKTFWNDILDFIGVNSGQLPELINPCTDIGTIKNDVGQELNLSKDVTLNIGILDHFAGMIGAGNTSPGHLSETTGTVLAIATLVNKPEKNNFPIPCHCGPFGNYVLLPVCESGGICLEWFKDNFYPEDNFSTLDKLMEKTYLSDVSSPLIFLPYIIGTNSPEFNSNVSGGFYGLRIQHKKIDFAISILEGISFLLKKNIDYLENRKIKVDNIISLGGASKSNFWNKIKANITKKDIIVPSYKEATSFGAAVIGFAEYNNITIDNKFIKSHLNYLSFKPDNKSFQNYDKVYKKFCDLYDCIKNFSV